MKTQLHKIHKLHADLSLTKTLAIAFMALSVIILLISSSLQILSNTQTQREIITQHHQIVAQDASKTVSGFTQEKLSVLETAARITDLAGATSDEQRQILNGLLGVQPAFRRLLVLNRQGQTVAQATQITAQIKGDPPADIPLGQRYIGPVSVNPISNEPTMLMAVPTKSLLGDLTGALVAEVNLRFMWELVDQLHVGETGHVYVVDRQGQLIAFSDTARVLRGENVGQLQVVSDFIQHPGATGATEVRVYQGITGETVIGTFVALRTPDWAVVTELPWDEANSAIIWDVIRDVAITLLIAALASALGIVTARRLAVPLINLTATATRITEGEIRLQAVVRGPKEVSRLARAFNSMTAQLRQSLESLEQRVAERTSDLQRANADLAAAKLAAEEASRLKTQFLATISHELRTPLNAILNFTHFMGKERYGTLNGRQTDLQQRVLTNAEHLLGLINDILDISRLDSGELELQIELAALPPILHDAMATAAELSDDKDLRLTLEYADDLPSIAIDPARIRQVLLNLISNAVKFTSEGGVAVRASVIGPMLQVAVQDTGIGIAPEHQELIFEQFRQVQDDLHREYQGTGLGLPISRRLIEMHGGRLWVESAVGVGSTFCFTLPIA